jgi:hypothetical protein
MPVVLSRFLEGGRSLELVEDRAPIQTARKTWMNSSLDRVQAAPFFVHRSAL